VRYRLMATYRGSPFEAGIGPRDGDIVLFAACPPPEDLGFEPATGHWRKQLPISEVQAVWESRPVGVFRGERCMVLDDLGDRLHIGYLGHDGYQAEQLGYWQVDRGVFELVAARSEVTDIIEERTEYPRRRAASAEAGAPAPPADMPPGSPQDQAMYLPPEPQDQASYLLDRPEYVRSQRYGLPAAAHQQDSPGYQQAGPPAGQYSWPDPALAGQHPSGPVLGRPVPATPVPDRPVPAVQPDPGYALSREHSGTIAMPPADERPLPLEAAALRAATASRPRSEARRPGEDLAPDGPRPDPSRPARRANGTSAPIAAAPVLPGRTGMAEAVTGTPETGTPPAGSPPAGPGPAPKAAGPSPQAGRARAGTPAPGLTAPGQPTPATTSPATTSPATTSPAGATEPAAAARPRRRARRRLATERLFAELASLAGIPVDSYAIGEEVEGALCLLETEQGFEVFHSSEGNRHELQLFGSEEAACFYLFGVLAAEAVRKGALMSAAGHITGQLPAVRIAP